jgi:flagellar basal body rod protein FlgC
MDRPSPYDQRFVMDVKGKLRNPHNGVVDKMKVRVILRDNEALLSIYQPGNHREENPCADKHSYVSSSRRGC